MTVYTAVTRQGTVTLWPVRLPGDDGKSHSAWDSAHDAADRATRAWTKMQWNAGLGSYDIYEANGIPAEPQWPEESFQELLAIAFRGKLIDTPDHPVIKSLRGEA